MSNQSVSMGVWPMIELQGGCLLFDDRRPQIERTAADLSPPPGAGDADVGEGIWPLDFQDHIVIGRPRKRVDPGMMRACRPIGS